MDKIIGFTHSLICLFIIFFFRIFILELVGGTFSAILYVLSGNPLRAVFSKIEIFAATSKFPSLLRGDL